MTPKGLAIAVPRPQSPGPAARVPRATAVPDRADLETILMEERDGAVYFARIPDLGRFMAARKLHVAEDVLETLSDLVLSLVGEEGNDGSGSRG